MQSDSSDSSAGPIAQRVNSLQSDSSDTRGKHRIQAELKRLDQETRYLQEELERLDKMEMASAACKELLGLVEIRPDPLLPVTNGPVNPAWDRWFESAQDSQGCRCWML